MSMVDEGMPDSMNEAHLTGQGLKGSARFNNTPISIDDDDHVAAKRNGSATVIKCEVCLCEMSSDTVLASHITGSRHKKRLKALEIVKSLQASGENVIQTGLECKQMNYHCGICSLSLNSPQQLEVHISGAKHRNKLAKERSINFPSNNNSSSNQVYEIAVPEELSNHTNPPPTKKRKNNNQSLSCNLCNIMVNSQVQYEQHILSKKHSRKIKKLN